MEGSIDVIGGEGSRGALTNRFFANGFIHCYNATLKETSAVQ